MSIKVTKNGKVVQDTTYQFDDASEAKHAIKMLEVLSGDDPGSHPHSEHVIVVKSDDGNTFDILIDEDCEDGNIVKKKEVRVVVEGDEDGNWSVVESEEKDLTPEKEE